MKKLILVSFILFGMFSNAQQPACASIFSFSSQCVVTSNDTFAEFSWGMFYATSNPPESITLEIESTGETLPGYHCDDPDFQTYTISLTPYVSSYQLSHTVINLKCFRWRLKPNCTSGTPPGWTIWKEFDFNDCP